MPYRAEYTLKELQIRSEVITAVAPNSAIFSYVIPCKVKEVYLRFKEKYYLILMRSE
jgi:hypothetical protein